MCSMGEYSVAAEEAVLECNCVSYLWLGSNGSDGVKYFRERVLN